MGKQNVQHYEKLKSLFSFNKEKFVTNSIKVHGNIYDYSLVNYINNKTKVKIICKKHSIFEQRPDNHTYLGQGCPMCKSDKQSSRLLRLWEEILEDFNKIHNFKFDYSEVIYINMRTNISIICPVHGVYNQKPANHIVGKACQKCYNDRRKKMTDTVFKLAKKIKCLIRNSYTKKGYSKKSKTFEILGCNYADFKEHLENNIYGFKVENTDLDLDYIIPKSEAKNEEDIIRLNHYTNFQLLPNYYNRNIKRDKPFNKVDFENWLNNNK